MTSFALTGPPVDWGESTGCPLYQMSRLLAKNQSWSVIGTIIYKGPATRARPAFLLTFPLPSSSSGTGGRAAVEPDSQDLGLLIYFHTVAIFHIELDHQHILLPS